MTTVVAVRHGETEWNREGRIQGWAASPLNDRGRRQARAVGRHLDDTYDLDRIVASDLRRTRETSAHLRSAGEFPEPEFTKGWRERSFGAFQGLSYEQVFSEFPEHRASFGMVGLENTPERGESLLEARERVIAAWDDLLEGAGPDEEVLVVTHGGPIYVLLAHLRGLDLSAALTNFSQGNCAVNELEHDQETGETEILRENETGYRDIGAVE
ncbi:histidine phosphatase family protein [Halorientalis regularis]|uniref:Probable phosphoglycerate mutase n=1 Tax=Halorientalis regularis TaxID=660518 RepID=A0A1G7GZC1_9EURY|nr:histidine phosphatase family protein [Halorientalis regularis]SDE93424.1 probable phosphoglycerate mutase [Halorientalis regularis]